MFEPRRGISTSAGYWYALRLMTLAPGRRCTTTVTTLSPPSFLLLCHCIVHIPHRWDLALTLIILQTCFTVPIRVAFPNEPSDCNRKLLGQVLHTSQILVVCGRCFSPVRLRKFWRTSTLAKYLFRVCPSDCERAFVRAHSSLIPF